MSTPAGDVVYFAKTNFRNQQRRFGIKLDDRRRHMYFIGKTGMGKTTVLENMMIQDVQNGHGLAVIDPHGDFVEKILDFIPPYRINDVVYINPADVDFPVAFNVLESINPAHRHLVASGLLSVFKKMWIDSWGPRLEYILRNCILSLMEYPGSTLLGIPRILADDDYRAKVVEKLTDPIVKAFWVTEFNQYAQQFRTEAISPIQNKIGQFLSSALIRNIVGQPKSTIDLRALMDEGKILLLNLSKGRIGEDNAGLLGGMMITKLQLAAMSRVDIPEAERKDFFLYVDEFQNFATESFANILSEARKYRLNLIIAHQYIEQLDENVQAAVFGNVGSIVCFRVGAGDAEFLAKEFAPVFDETDLVNLTKYDIYLRLMIDGVASDPFSATTLEPISGRTGNRDKVIAVSRERYANTREIVEEKISRWSAIDEAAFAQRPPAGRGGPRRGGGGGNGGGGGAPETISPSKLAELLAKPAKPEPSPDAPTPATEVPAVAPVEPEIPKEVSLSEALKLGANQFGGKGGPRPGQGSSDQDRRRQPDQPRRDQSMNRNQRRDNRPPHSPRNDRPQAQPPREQRQPDASSRSEQRPTPPPLETPATPKPAGQPVEESHALQPGQVVKFD